MTMATLKGLRRFGLGLLAGLWLATPAAALDELAAAFAAPPDSARPMVRWWWFGNAVQADEIERELKAMRAGGFGGVEIQPVYPMSLDDEARGIRNQRYLSPGFLDALRGAQTVSREQGLGFELTLGSGWPFGGPHVGIEQASSRIGMQRSDVAAGEETAMLPAIAAGERLLAVFVAPGTGADFDPAALERVPLLGRERQPLPPSTQARTMLAFYQTRTGQQVKRPGLGGEGFVLDHLNRAAVEHHLKRVGERLLSAFPLAPPDAVFSDSLEVYDVDWTDDLPDEFRARRGYALLDRLPDLFFERGPESLAVRHDWGKTLTELVEERYLRVVDAWARSQGTHFRSQSYGFPPVSLSGAAIAERGEGEGHDWRGFSTMRWASSANHLYERPVTSAEAWTWLHSPAFRATPLDLKAEADRLFLQGANQLVAHGWPYTPPGVDPPGWSFYAAGVFSDQNPWWGVMPEVNLYLRRLSWLLRQGEPVNDVAIYVPTADAWATTRPGRATITDAVGEQINTALSGQLLDGGYGFDYIDAQAIAAGRLRHRALLLPDVERIAPEDYARIAEYAKAGGIVLAVGERPRRSAGLIGAAEGTRHIRKIGERLFDRGRHKARVVALDDLAAALGQWLPPDVQAERPSDALGFVHRRVAGREVYFVANTTETAVHDRVLFRDAGDRAGQVWRPADGHRCAIAAGSQDLHLAPYESLVFVFAADLAPAAPCRESTPREWATLSDGWEVRFDDADWQPVSLPHDWTRETGRRHTSGVVRYRRQWTVPSEWAADGRPLWLDLGEGRAVSRDPSQRGTRAWIDGPVRESAEVYLNGRRVGAIWAPPYRLDLSGRVQAGRNDLEIRVGNLAVNALAGKAAPDHRLLKLRHGDRFQPQDWDRIEPLPSGLFGPVRVLGE